ncbi:Cysteine desulfurase [Candidatus Burarchaeum australiense]|nr:Cysteine desulfurase [Candidatus Burarchaeum australiense]
MDLNAIRKDFPILKDGLVYLDNAATSLTPEPVLSAMLEYYRRYRANIHRGAHRLSLEATEKYDEARRRVAKFIGAREDELIFTKNATEAINLVALTLAWNRGDLVQVGPNEHHSNLLPWQRLARQGVKLEFRDNFDFGGKGVRLIAVNHISNVLGSQAPVERIAKEKGEALLLVDGAQSVPHIPISVKKLGCDFLAFSGHKMLGPTGIGALYMRHELMEKMEGAFLGGGEVMDASREGYKLAKGPQGWEAGTPNIAGAIGLAVACDYLSKLGMENVHRHCAELSAFTAEKMRGIRNVPIYGAENGIVSFNVKGMKPHDVSLLLDRKAHICTRSGHHCAMPLMKKLGVDGTVRASYYIYNTKEEAELLAKTVGEIAELA